MKNGVINEIKTINGPIPSGVKIQFIFERRKGGNLNDEAKSEDETEVFD